MLLFFLIKTLFLWSFALMFAGVFISFVYKRAKGKHIHLRFSNRLTIREIVTLLLLLSFAAAMTLSAIPYTVDTYLYVTDSYPTEYAKVIKVLYYTRGVGRGSILIEDGYRTIFSINGKEATMIVKRKLTENTIYKIRYLPNSKYVLQAW